MGLHRVWPDAHIVGVDINSQPRYPFIFEQADAMTYPLDGFDFAWASPPCQKYTTLKTVWNYREGHPDYIAALRVRLQGVPHVIENVPGAPLQSPALLCGTAFGLGVVAYDGWRELRRHRLFECSFPVISTECFHKGATIGIYGDHARDKRRKPGVRHRGIDFPDQDRIRLGREALQIPWAGCWREISQAIPPAYAEYVANHVL